MVKSWNVHGYIFVDRTLSLSLLTAKIENGLVNPLMSTLKPQNYGNTVIGTLAVDGWVVAFGAAMKDLGGLRPRPVPSSLYQMYQPTRQRPVYQLIVFNAALQLLFHSKG